jgi:hypothetical protein
MTLFIQNHSVLWNKAELATPLGATLSSQLIPPIRVKQVFNPITITEPQPNIYIYDFGQEFSGFCQLSVRGPRGNNVTMGHAEVLMPDGSGMVCFTISIRFNHFKMVLYGREMHFFWCRCLALVHILKNRTSLQHMGLWCNWYHIRLASGGYRDRSPAGPQIFLNLPNEEPLLIFTIF